jgi:hypothetical protein
VGADVVLVTNGSVGKAFDELAMNQLLFATEGVKLRGVVLNKVKADKVEMVRDYVGRLLQERWGVPLLGVVPDLPFLGKASLRDVEKRLDAEMLAGRQCLGLHYGLDDAFLVTTGLRRFLRRAFEERGSTWRRPLLITHVTRDDLLLGFLAHHQKMMKLQGGEVGGATDWAGAMILSMGASEAFPDLKVHSEDYTMHPYLRKMAEDTNAPVLVTRYGTLDTLQMVKSFRAKHNVDDQPRVKAAIEHYTRHIDFDTLLDESKAA